MTDTIEAPSDGAEESLRALADLLKTSESEAEMTRSKLRIQLGRAMHRRRLSRGLTREALLEKVAERGGPSISRTKLHAIEMSLCSISEEDLQSLIRVLESNQEAARDV